MNNFQKILVEKKVSELDTDTKNVLKYELMHHKSDKKSYIKSGKVFFQINQRAKQKLRMSLSN